MVIPLPSREMPRVRQQPASRAMVRAAPKRRAPVRRAAPSGTVGRLRGHGAYTYDNPGPWGKYGRAAGTMLGAKYGGPIGSALGGKLGSYAHYIGRLFGSGDYQVASPLDSVKQNVLVNEGQTPIFGAGGEGVCRIRKREYVCDIISSANANTFQIQSFSINPGLASTFQWLSQVCGATFQQYRLNGCVFEFRSMSADALNSANTALGQIVMATDYDSADAAFATKGEMENTVYAISCKPSSCAIHAIECAPRQTTATELYVRAYANPSGTDVRLYDWGKFYIASNGCQGTSVNLGELWVSYDVTLFKPILQPPGYMTQTAHIALDPTQFATAPFSKLAGGTNFDTIGLTFAANGLSFTFPLSIPAKSWWLFEIEGLGTATASLNILSFSGSNGLTPQGTNFQTPGPNGSLTANRQTTTTVYQYDGVSATPAALPTITVTLATMLSAYATCNLRVTMLNGTYVN